MTSICLCMIVKDESTVIERCLDSVRNLISYWVICDTGSSDGTQNLIRRTLADVPGELHERPWVDFGHNRSEALALAAGKADYLLLLDADWTIAAETAAFDDLSADAYLVRHEHPRGDDFELYNRNLVRGDLEWRYVGVAHEYLEGDGKSEARLAGASIVNWADGGVGRAKRWEQDRELLERELKRDDSNARNIFYLAQTYRDLGQLEKAADLYEQRAALGGWAEEVYYSLYQVGCIEAELGDWPRGMAALIRAFEFRPVRLEALYELATRLRQRGEYETAHLFAARGIGRPQPDDILFVSPWVYRWGLIFEYSITAYWTGDPAEALRTCDYLLTLDDLPDAYREQTIANRKFCEDRVKAEKTSESPGELSGPVDGI